MLLRLAPFAPFAPLALLVACTSAPATTDLASLPGDARIEITGDGTGVASLTVLGGSANSPSTGDCLVLDATATENGAAMAVLDPGHLESTWGDQQCRPPAYQISGRVGGPAASTFELTDGTATIAIDIPTMFAHRDLALAPVDTLASGDTMTLTSTLAAGDQRTLGYVRAERPDLPPEHVSCNQLFYGNATETPTGYTFTLPADIFTTLEQEGCAFDITRGQTVAAELGLEMELAPAIARCDGVAHCSADIQFATTVRGTVRP